MSDAADPREGATGSRGFDLDTWVRPLCSRGCRGCGLRLVRAPAGVRIAGRSGHGQRVVVAAVRGRPLALGYGRPAKPSATHTRRARGAVWSAFLLGIAVSLAANVAAAPALEWKPVLVAGWPPVALLLSVELLVHRPDGMQGERGGRRGQEKREQLHDDDDPLLAQARLLDARHRELHQRPASAETLRKELRVGAGRSRQLAALVRRNRSAGAASEAPVPDRTQGSHQ